MLTISAIKSTGDASRYYSQDNYYTQDEGIEHSAWYGQGAAQLGLDGRVQPDTFASLMHGQVDGVQLGRMSEQGIEHRPGWDLTFSAPKSVSILSEVYGMETVRQAHQQAVQEALSFVEANYLQTRLSVNGEVLRLPTDNALFATFTHDVSRELDPQLHTHAVLLNATKTPNGWRSIANEKLMDRNAIMASGMAYRAALARELTGLGFQLEQHRDPRLFEVKGVPEALMTEFSKRAAQIQDYFDRRGLTYDSAYAKQVALATRRKKEHVPREELRELWRERAAPYSLADGLHQSVGVPTGTVKQDLLNAITHLQEGEMSFTELELMTETMRLGLGRVGLADVQAEIRRMQRRGELLEGRHDPEREERLLTTRRAKQAEERLLSTLKRGKGFQKALLSEKQLLKALKGTSLNDQQREAVIAAARSRSRYFAIQGDPGVGKTTTLRVYKQALEKAGYQVMAFAPSYQAVNELSQSLGIAGMTVDRFLVDPRAQRAGGSLARQVWIVDEASMLDTEKVNQIMIKAEERNARVLLVGDHQQLESVGAGRAFRQLQEGGIDLAVIDKRMRQKNDHMKAVVDHVMDKRYGQALGLMAGAGQVVQAKEGLERLLADEYLRRVPEHQRQTLVVTPTNEQRERVNHWIREGLREQGTIRGHDFTVSVYADVRLSEQEKRMAQMYEKGQVVRFNYDAKTPDGKAAVKRHEYYEVIGRNVTTNKIALKRENSNETLVIDPASVGGHRPGGIQVYERSSISLAEGDRVKWLDNANTEGLKRNTELTVVRGHKDWVRLEDGKGKSYSLSLGDTRHRHFEHDYARTAYGVQGKTDRDVLALMDSRRINTVNQKSFMVALTRAEREAKVFTDDVGKLTKALGERSGSNTEALTDREFSNHEPRRTVERRPGLAPRMSRLI
ncbi:MAG: relaxase domain-containing protein [Marinobacter sp.]|nr:relaxase domain-containing protein [Marinobacter sp.]